MADIPGLITTTFVVDQIPLAEIRDAVREELSSGSGIVERLKVFERCGGVSVYQGPYYLCSYGIVYHEGKKGRLWLLPGKGLESLNKMTLFKVIRDAINNLIKEAHLEEVYAHVWKPNIQGAKLVRLLGMECEGLNDNGYYVYKRTA